MLNTVDRHPGTQHFAKLFEFEHLAHAEMRATSASFHALAQELIDSLPDGPELTVALRKLLEAKDAAVRCHL